jgi:excisionase family DNA binding protein
MQRRLTDYLNSKEASEYLGISHVTLKRWVNGKKIPTYSHPITGKDLFLKEDLDALTKSITLKEYL